MNEYSGSIEVKNCKQAATLINEFIDKARYQVDSIDLNDYDDEPGAYLDLVQEGGTLNSFLAARDNWSIRGELTKGDEYGLSNVVAINNAQAIKGQYRRGFIVCELDNRLYIHECAKF